MQDFAKGALTDQPVALGDFEAGRVQPQALERTGPIELFEPRYRGAPTLVKPGNNSIGPPICQGISLVSTHTLPDRFRAIFPYPLFNAVQSKCFDSIYKSNQNFVLSAPTGSGKTAVIELAICRLTHDSPIGSFKIVYQAPTKSLCSERYRDWNAKFGPLDLQCAELTGDTENSQLRSVQYASIIITTPEKWDSVTRKWKDHQKLMQMVKLFLIDEVHILKEDRGATLEAVVSRMKSIGSNVRFVALSATVPNSQDVSTWLGQDPVNPHLPAQCERFGEEFRPVKLQKHVCGYQANTNDFAFEKTLNGKLPEVITKWSQRKPIMVFCFTRASCVETAKLLANWWATKGPRERYWATPRNRVRVGEKDLKDTVSSGVAFHHAGLSVQDRSSIEKAYVEGDVNVICCTSTLAVGVNLPCHMVIIKNTVSYQNGGIGSCKEYSDLEIMQMLGRAGRPQYDDSAVAVIMTRTERASHYDKMITGQEILESCLHRNLIDHLNAEIALGTVNSASSARKWLSGTFLHVRLKENPDHYRIEGDAPGRDLDERLENICQRGIALLQGECLLEASPTLKCTEFGNAMARYYLQFETMKAFLAIPPKAKVSEILSAISQAAEFKALRFRAGEKNAYKNLNKNGSIKFPIPVNLDGTAHKVSLIIQSVLGAVELPTEDYKHRTEYTMAKAVIFQHVHRLIRCIVDCQLHLEDAITTRNALMLARSLGAQVWDDSPLHLKQLDTIGVVAVRKLVAFGITSIEDLESAEAHDIERVLSRNPPHGRQVQEKARAFPRLRVCIKKVGEPTIKKNEHVTVRIKAEIGFLNENVPQMFQCKAVYVCLLVETSDGQLIHFARISAKKLNRGQDVLCSANLTSAAQSVCAYVMCDEIAGTMRFAMLRPEITPTAFPPLRVGEELSKREKCLTYAPDNSKRRVSRGAEFKAIDDSTSDEFGDPDIKDSDLVAAIEAGTFIDIDDIDDLESDRGRPNKKSKVDPASFINENREHQQLANGKWACNHPCKDKTTCGHTCCKDGLGKKPRPSKQKDSKRQTEPHLDQRQSQLNMPMENKSAQSTLPAASIKKAISQAPQRSNESKEAQKLAQIRKRTKTSTTKVTPIGKSRTTGEDGYGYAIGDRLHPCFLGSSRNIEDENDHEYDTWESTDLPEIKSLCNTPLVPNMNLTETLDSYHLQTEDRVRKNDGGGSHNFQSLQADGDGDIEFYSHPSCSEFGNTPDQENGANENEDNRNYEPLPETRPTYNQVSCDEGESFFSANGDSAADGLGAQHRQGKRKHSVLQQRASSCELLVVDNKQRPDLHSQSNQSREEMNDTLHTMAVNAFESDFADDVAATIRQDDPVSNPDGLEKWFKEEFGTEYFNFAG